MQYFCKTFLSETCNKSGKLKKYGSLCKQLNWRYRQTIHLDQPLQKYEMSILQFSMNLMVFIFLHHFFTFRGMHLCWEPLHQILFWAIVKHFRLDHTCLPELRIHQCLPFWLTQTAELAIPLFHSSQYYLPKNRLK